MKPDGSVGHIMCFSWRECADEISPSSTFNVPPVRVLYRQGKEKLIPTYIRICFLDFCMVNVGKYTIHGSCGLGRLDQDSQIASS